MINELQLKLEILKRVAGIDREHRQVSRSDAAIRAGTGH